MGCEINVEAGNRLNLRDAVALSHSYFLMLKAAFEQRLGQVGGVAVMLDSVAEIAAIRREAAVGRHTDCAEEGVGEQCAAKINAFRGVTLIWLKTIAAFLYKQL